MKHFLKYSAIAQERINVIAGKKLKIQSDYVG